MKVTFRGLYNDLAHRGQIIKKTRNRPEIGWYRKPDEYLRIFHGKTRNRKVAKPLIAFGTTFATPIVVDFYGITETHIGVFELESFKNERDPVSVLVKIDDKSLKKVDEVLKVFDRPAAPVKKVIGENYVIGSTEGLKLVSRDKVPANAVLVSIAPLYWLQIGRGRLLLTRGAVWLDEDISEFDSEYMVVKKEGDHYVVMFRAPEGFDYPVIEGIFRVYPGATPVGARAVMNDVEEYGEEVITYTRIVDSSSWREIVKIILEDGTVSVMWRDESVPVELLTTFEKIFVGDKPYYVPLKYLVRWRW